MNIKDFYWKCKRVFRKYKDTIARVISVTLIVCLVVLLGVVAYNIVQSDKRREEIANQEKDKTTIKAVKKYDYGEPGFQQVAENGKMILSADYTTGEIRITEKATGKEWFSNPQDREQDELATVKNKLHAQFYMKCLNLDKGINVEYDNYSGSIQKGNMKHEKVEDGVKFIFGFPGANVYVPVQYTLTEDGFQVEIVTSEIKGVGANPFLVESVSLLPFFGAGGLEDEGYLFVPDGSGALIDFNNGKQSMQSYLAPVYGRNLTMPLSNQETVREGIHLPVFGAKVNDNAFFAVITAGEGCSTISATTSRKNSSYNQIYASAVLREYSLKKSAGTADALNSSHTVEYSQDLMDGENYCIRYFFLEGEDANYTGMANCYRDYLKDSGKLKDSPLADEKYMVVDLMGAVSIKKYVMGIKRPVVTALTSYNEVCEIVKELKAQGVENIVINYVGALNSGLNNKMYTSVKTESVLGSKKEFDNMVNYLQEQGVLLFMESDPVNLYENGNGYKENKDSVKTFFNKYAFQYQYKLDLGTSDNETRWHLLRPALVSELVAKFAESVQNAGLKNVSFEGLGDTVYSDYSEDNYISRTGTLKLWNEALKAADEASEYLMVHGGNVYANAYADVITDVPDVYSNFDMQDRSIPFYQMVFQGDTLLTAGGINTTVDYEQAFLKAMETGCSLKYNWIYGDVSQLVGTEYNTMVSYSYDYWKNVAVEEYKQMQAAVGSFAGKQIIGHEYLSADVTLTRYESGDVIVNYGTEAFTYGDVTVEARDYLILTGGAK